MPWRRDEELVAAIIDKVGSIQYQFFLRVIEHPWSGRYLTNPDDIAFNTWGSWSIRSICGSTCFRGTKRWARSAGEKGLGFIFHSDGDCTEAMDDLIDCGFHAYNPIQPNAMDIVEVKRRWGKRLCLIGNIDLDSTLTRGRRRMSGRRSTSDPDDRSGRRLHGRLVELHHGLRPARKREGPARRHVLIREVSHRAGSGGGEGKVLDLPKQGSEDRDDKGGDGA